MGRLKLVGEREVGGAVVAILEGDTSIVAEATALSFAPADFLVEDAGDGRANVALDYVNGAMALADKSRPSPWVSAGDLAARSIADLGTRDHDLLSGLGDDDHDQYASLAGRGTSQDLAGGVGSGNLYLRAFAGASDGVIKLSESAPHVTMDGAVKVNNYMGIACLPTAYDYLAIKPIGPAWTASQDFIEINPSGATLNASGSVYGVAGLQAPSIGSGVWATLAGLFFQAGHAGGSGTVSTLYGLRMAASAMGSIGGFTDCYGAYLSAVLFSGKPTNSWGMYIRDFAKSGVSVTKGLQVDDQDAGSSTRYIAWFGNSGLAKVRIDAAYSQANKSSLCADFGGTEYRIIRNAATGALETEAA